MQTMKHILCIDYGDKHCGLAIATTSLAEPIETVSIDKALAKIKALISAYHIEELVFGLSEGKMAEKTRQFAATIGAETKLPIKFHDETLTSYDTRRRIAQAGAKKSKREQKIDHLVAAAILEDYLDS